MSLRESDSNDNESVTLLNHVSLLNNDFTTKEQLSICCKPSFRLRILKSKGAILVLIWNYLCLSIPYFYLQITENSHGIEFYIVTITFGLTLSIAGWIADVHFGRYRVIYLSIWIMWAALILDTVSYILRITVDSYNSVHNYVNGVLWTIIIIGLGGYLANAIQFGIDQLHDASSDEISSFIVWYIWTYFSSGFVVSFIYECLQTQHWIIGNLVMCIYMTIALTSILLFHRWLVKEPAMRNPFKLVYSVIRYAIKHKHPEYRSAFTYCEDEPPSRIDFGKSKYGGPFTTEQVEDVKTFLRSFVVILIGMVLFGVMVSSMPLLKNVSNMLIDSGGKFFFVCYSKQGFLNYFLYGSAIILPLCELIFYPVFHRILDTVNRYCHWKYMGIFLPLAEIVSLLVIEIVSRHNYLASDNFNTTIHCTGHLGTLSTSIDFRWMAVPQLLYSLSTAVILIRGAVFITSQVPYSMRGLLMGTACCLLVLCTVLGLSISIPFSRQLSIWGTGIISCGFWHALLLLVVGVLAGLVFSTTLKWYKKRKREDVLPNEHIFAERYYDN